MKFIMCSIISIALIASCMYMEIYAKGAGLCWLFAAFCVYGVYEMKTKD